MRRLFYAALAAHLTYRLFCRMQAHDPQSEEYQRLRRRAALLQEDYENGARLTVMAVRQQTEVLYSRLPGEVTHDAELEQEAFERGLKTLWADQRLKSYLDPADGPDESSLMRMRLNADAVLDSFR